MACVKLNASLFAMAVKMLMSGPTTTKEISERTGLAHLTVLELLREMRRQKTVYVCGWLRDSGQHASIRVYSIGCEPDAPKPPPLTDSQRNQRYRMKVLARAGVEPKKGIPKLVAADLHGGWNAGQERTIPETASN